MESELLGIDLGELVDVCAYDKVGKAFWSVFPEVGGKPSEFAITAGVAWNNVGYRARAASESLKAFAQQFERHSKAPHEQIYSQVNHFFSFLTNVTSVAESMVYAAHIARLGLKREPLTKVNLKALRNAQLADLKADARLTGVGTLLQTRLDEKAGWWEMRDVLMHRGQPPRNLYVGGPKDSKTMMATNPKAPPQEWIDEFDFHATCGNDLATWLKGSISDLSIALPRALS